MAANSAVRFTGQRRQEVYDWAERTLVRHEYAGLTRVEPSMTSPETASSTGLESTAGRGRRAVENAGEFGERAAIVAGVDGVVYVIVEGRRTANPSTHSQSRHAGRRTSAVRLSRRQRYQRRIRRPHVFMRSTTCRLNSKVCRRHFAIFAIVPPLPAKCLFSACLTSGVQSIKTSKADLRLPGVTG